MWRQSEQLDSHTWRWDRGGRGSARGRGRGEGRGRGRGDLFLGATLRGRWSSQSAPKQTSAASPEPSLGPLVSSLSKNDFHQKAKDYKSKSFVTNCRTVACYNWLDRAEPTIVVPGKPPKWTPLASPRQLELDDGQYFRDVNSANFPKHPIEPAVVASLTMQTNLPQETDIVACGSTIGNLLRFLQGEDKPFRTLVELVGETVFFTRRENTSRELISDVCGYGHTFPEAYTTWDPEVKGSTSHQRVISYQFGGLELLVRFECDGYILNEDSDGQDAHAMPSRTGNLDVGAELDFLSAELAGSRVTHKLPKVTNDGLKILRAGEIVKQDSVFDLKTRSTRKKEIETFEVTLSDQLKRLWVAQIPNFILAYHTRGVFEDIHIKNVRDEVNDWEKTHVDVLSRLAALIHHIIGLVRARSDHKIELRHDAVGILEVREQLADAGDVLSESVKNLWKDGEDHFSRESSPDGDIVLVTNTASEGSSTRDWDDEFEPDYTACSAEDCGYCGKCSY